MEIAHAHDLPVIVDAASYLPPRANLTRFIEAGADMVSVLRRQGRARPAGDGHTRRTPPICIEAAYANASPHQFIGRGMKVAKEEIIGLVEALRIFVDEDEEAETRTMAQMCGQVVDALIEMPGLDVSVEHDRMGLPHAHSDSEVHARLGAAPPATTCETRSPPETRPSTSTTYTQPDELGVDPFNLDERELEIVIDRLRETLLGG